MYTGHMDFFSWILYLMLGAVALVCVKVAKSPLNRGELRHETAQLYRFGSYAVLIALFTFFAVFRGVGEKLGGSDALNYKMIFINCLNPGSKYFSMVSEPLFRWYCQTIRLFTEDYKVFFAISYGLIAVSYCVFIESYCPRNAAAVPFVLLIFPYLKAFCTLRSSLAVAVFLIALVYVDKKPWLSNVLMLSTIFIHRMAVAYAVFFVFDYLFRKWILRFNGIKLGAMLFVIALAGVWAARAVQYIIVGFGILDTTDNWYLRQSMGTSLFRRFPMFLAHMLVFFALVVLGDRVKRTKNWGRLKRFIAYDIVILPATLVLGFWRANEFMYLVRLCVWSTLIPKGEPICVAWMQQSQWLRSRKWAQSLQDRQNCMIIYRIGMCLLFGVWLMFRIYSEWDDLKIMPYVLDLF